MKRLCLGSVTSFPVETEGFPSPCPLCPAGECYLTEWTIWSRCQISCVNGNDLGFGSVQVRSRAVVAQDPENLLQCPEQELEARPCTGQTWHVADRETHMSCGSNMSCVSLPEGECFEYQWKTGPWRGSSRNVWCERTDGLNVTGKQSLTRPEVVPEFIRGETGSIWWSHDGVVVCPGCPPLT